MQGVIVKVEDMLFSPVPLGCGQACNRKQNTGRNLYVDLVLDKVKCVRVDGGKYNQTT